MRLLAGLILVARRTVIDNLLSGGALYRHGRDEIGGTRLDTVHFHGLSGMDCGTNLGGHMRREMDFGAARKNHAVGIAMRIQHKLMHGACGNG